MTHVQNCFERTLGPMRTCTGAFYLKVGSPATAAIPFSFCVGLQTYVVSSTFTQQFSSVQSCLPLSLSFVTANDASQNSYRFKVNSTSAECALSSHCTLPSPQSWSVERQA